MIDTQTFHDVILVLAVLITLTVALSAVMLAAPSISRPGRKPHGGTWRDLQPGPQPQPEPEPQPQPDAEEARELVLR